MTGTNNQVLNYNLAVTSSPAQIAKAYGFDNIRLGGGILGTGAGQTVGIYGIGDVAGFVSSTNPNFANSDFNQFNLAHGLANFNTEGGPVFLKVDQFGGTNFPIGAPTDPTEVCHFFCEAKDSATSAAMREACEPWASQSRNFARIAPRCDPRSIGPGHIR